MKNLLGLKSYPKVYFELMLLGLSVVMGMSLQSAFLPLFANDLDPSGNLIGFVVSAFFLSRVFIELPSGILSDVLSKRKLLISGISLTALGAGLCAIAGNITPLIIGRALWGFGTALFFICTTSLIFDIFKSEMRGRALGNLQGVEFTGSFIGAPIGGFLASKIGYNNVYLISFVLLLLCSCIAYFSRNLLSTDMSRQKVDKPSWKPDFRNLGGRNLIAIYVNSFTRMFVNMGIVGTVIPLYFNHQLKIGVDLIGVVLSFRTIGMVASTITAGYLSDIIQRRYVVIIGILISSSASFLFSIATFLETLLSIALLEGIGGGMVHASLIVLLSETAAPEQRGSAIGVYRTLMDFGGLIGPPIFVFVLSYFSAQVAFYVAVVSLLFSMILLLRRV